MTDHLAARAAHIQALRDVTKQGTPNAVTWPADPSARSACCAGELCGICRNPAYTKVEETIFDDDDPIGIRHPLTAYVCREHFRQIMGGRGVDLLEAVTS